MARRRITVRDVAEIMEHWQAGRSIRVITGSLGADRGTIRNYIAVAMAITLVLKVAHHRVGRYGQHKPSRAHC